MRVGVAWRYPRPTVVGDELSASFEHVQQRDWPISADQGNGGINLHHGQPPPGRGDRASPSRVCAFSRTRSLSSSAWKVARSTTVGVAGASPVTAVNDSRFFEVLFTVLSLRI